MTTEEILLTVLTVSIVVLISIVVVVLLVVLRVVKKVNTAIDGVQHAVTTGTDIVQSFAPVGIATAVFRAMKVMKKRK